MTATLATPSVAPPRLNTSFKPARYTVERIEGRYRAIPAIQLATAAWLYFTTRITLRQLRAYFALHEMAEQRCYAKTKTAKERPVYKIEQVARLVGGSGSASALRDLQRDVNALGAIGLVRMEAHAIHFAKKPSTLAVGEGGGEAFRAFLDAFQNLGRTVPVPRRLLRALAAGFRRTETLYITAFLLRSVFWSKEKSCFTVDGRMKGSWLAESFGLSRRSVTSARAHLIELGWITPLEVHQVVANRYGIHDIVNVHWQPGDEGTGANDLEPALKAEPSTEAPTGLPTDSVDKSEVQPPQPVGGFASPPADSAGGFASPPADSAGGFASPINKKTSLKRELNTRRLTRELTGSAGGGNREEKNCGGAGRPEPCLRDVRAEDLQDTDRLLALHTQAITAGFAVGGEAGRIDFLAMANRAATRGRNPGGLLLWLLKHEKTEFITQADEDAAAERLRAHLNGPAETMPGDGGGEAKGRGLTDDERLVEACIREAKRHRGLDPFLIVQRGKGWSREQWLTVRAGYERKQAQAQGWYAEALDL